MSEPVQVVGLLAEDRLHVIQESIANQINNAVQDLFLAPKMSVNRRWYKTDPTSQNGNTKFT